MKRTASHITAITALSLLGACTQFGWGQPEDSRVRVPVAPDAPVASEAEAAAGVVNSALTAAPKPAAAAKTQEALDTTTAAQRIEAAAPAAPQAAVTSLGTTIATLGSPTEPGFWLKTPLVKTQTIGRVTNKANGKSSAVTLIPIDGPATGGSRLSLPAMRVIEASLTELTELDVTLGG